MRAIGQSCRRLRLVVVGACACFAGGFCHSADLSLPLETGVKKLPSAKPPVQPNPMNAAMNPGQPLPAVPTLPGGKLPQYQLDRDHLADLSDAELKSAKRRLLVALPQQLLLLEATITIDGKPFALAREKRIKKLLQTADKGVEKREVEIEVPYQRPGEPKTEENAEENAEQDSEKKSEQQDADENESESKQDADDDSEADKKEKEKEEVEVEVVQPTVPRFTRVSGVDNFIRRYYAATNDKPTVEEIRWLITHRVDGPVLLMLNDNFQRFRAGERPAFNVLDRDLDGTVSKDEVDQAVDSFERCDENQNDIVDYKELEAMANRVPASRKHSGVGKLVSLVPTSATASIVYRRLAAHYQPDQSTTLKRFDQNTNGKFDPDEIESFRTAEPDVQVLVAFNTTDPSKSKIVVSKVGKSIHGQVSGSTSTSESISLRIGGSSEPGSAGTTIALSAIQKRTSDQVAIGAVSDGYPILPTLDPNEDGKFTIRERRQLLDRIKKIDTNKDGSITADEAQSTIRVCFALGPYVHQELASLRTLTKTSATTTPAGPGWFVRMDRNKDNDVSPREFSGNDEQFAMLDADSDKLISAAEATAFDSKNNAPKSKSNSDSNSKTSTTEASESSTSGQ